MEEITDQDILKLLELTDKCSNTLKKYVNARNFMAKDELISAISMELDENPSYEAFDHETKWLNDKFGNLCVEACQQFIQSESEANIQSMKILYRRIIVFREQFRHLYESADVRGNFERYLDEILKVAIGTALVCEDGLKYYKPAQFSARSIWLGSRMFLQGTDNLLQLASAGEL